MGGGSFRLLGGLSFGGQGVSELTVLPDTGADGFAFLNKKIAIRVASYTGAQAQRLPTPIVPAGFRGKREKAITHFICFNLMLDKRILPRIPFLILELGNVDMILGFTWMSYFNVKVDAANRTLEWPTEIPSGYDESPFVRKTIRPFAEILPAKTDQNHQEDARRRETLIELEEKRQASSPCRISTLDTITPEEPITRPDLPLLDGPTFEKEMEARMKKMEAELSARPEPNPIHIKKPPTPGPPKGNPPSTHQITEISAPAFRLNLRQPDTSLFALSLYELDREIEYREAALQDPELQEKLPQTYWEYADCFSKPASNEMPPHRSYDHKILLNSDAKLGTGPLYSMSHDELRTVREYLRDNLDKGFIVPSSAPFSSPVLFVKKADGSLRFCIDFRKLNDLTRKDVYPLPLIDETLARLKGAKIFTKLDIRQAFHRIRMDPDSEELTTFRTRYGNYKCKVLPFGLTNGPATYQRYMNDVLIDLLDVICTAYLDDILIYSDDPLMHEAHVKQVLQRLRSAGLQADIRKCEFGVTRTKYLGFIISTDGLAVDPDKVSTVVAWKEPKTVRGIQSFLGFCNFYRRFIPEYSRVARPLNLLTHNNVRWDFSKDCSTAFQKLKDALVNAPLLLYHDYNRLSRLETDSSDGVLAAVHSQKGPDEAWHPVGYFSKTMAPAEINYEIHDKEMLAIVRAFGHWRAELQGSPHKIEVFTDHKALEWFMSTKKLNGRQARWAEFLADFNFEIKYRPGLKNFLADALTRRYEDSEVQNEMKEASRHRPLLKKENLSEDILNNLTDDIRTNLCVLDSVQLVDSLLLANRTDPSLQEYRDAAKEDDSDYSLQDDLVLYKGRLLVPDTTDNLRTSIIQECHATMATAHAGAHKTYLLVLERYFWKSMREDIRRFVANCQTCGRSKVRRDKTPGLLHPMPIPDRPWQHICVDFKSQPADRHGYDNICVFIDRFTKIPVSIPCNKTATAKTMSEIYYVHVYRHHNLPDSVVSDRGPQFISDFWAALTSILGVKVVLSTAYSPQTDGQTEVMNQYCDQRLRPFVSHYQDNWSELLPAMDNAQLCLPHTSLGGLSPFLVSRGYSPRKSFDWKAPVAPTSAKEKLALLEATKYARRLYDVWKWAQDELKRNQEYATNGANKHRREPDWEVGDLVYLATKNLHTDRPSRKLSNPFAGPFPVVRQIGYSYELKIPTSWQIHPVFHARYLRKYPNDPLPGQENEEMEPINIVGDNEYVVEEILGVRTAKDGKGLRYKAKWLGYDEDPEFYPASDFKYSPLLLRDFHRKYPDKIGPPASLPEWLALFEAGEEAYEHVSDNRRMTDEEKKEFFREQGIEWDGKKQGRGRRKAD